MVSRVFVVYLSCEIGYYNIVSVLQKNLAMKGLIKELKQWKFWKFDVSIFGHFIAS